MRALYTQARDEPSGWGTDIAGYGQRYASSEGITVINGNVRLGMEFLFHEDLRYYPCRGCTVKRRLQMLCLLSLRLGTTATDTGFLH